MRNRHAVTLIVPFNEDERTAGKKHAERLAVCARIHIVLLQIPFSSGRFHTAMISWKNSIVCGYCLSMDESMGNTATVECDGRHVWTVKDMRTGSLRTLAYSDMMAEGLENFRIPDSHGGWYRIKSSIEVERKPVKCIRVDASDHVYRIKDDILTHNTGGGKSVFERNIIFSCISRSDDIKILGIDLKQVELSSYEIFTDAVLGIGTTLQDAVCILEYANKRMNDRYTSMKKLGYNDFKDVPNHGPAIMVIIDEAGQLLDSSGGRGDETAKAEGDLKGKAKSLIGSIARLGRAAHVHLVIATQRPDAKLIPGELKENLAFRAGCGHLTSIASSMAFDDATGTKTPAKPKGRAAIMVQGEKPEKLQVYYTPDASWITDWMRRHGKNPDNTPIDATTAEDSSQAEEDTVNIGDGIINQSLIADNSKDVDNAIKARQDATTAAETAKAEAVRKVPQADRKPAARSIGGLEPLHLHGDEDEENKHDPATDWDPTMDAITDIGDMDTTASADDDEDENMDEDEE